MPLSGILLIPAHEEKRESDHGEHDREVWPEQDRRNRAHFAWGAFCNAKPELIARRPVRNADYDRQNNEEPAWYLGLSQQRAAEALRRKIQSDSLPHPRVDTTVVHRRATRPRASVHHLLAPEPL